MATPQWDYEPHTVYEITYKDPRTLIQEFEDGTELRIEVNARSPRTMTEKYSVTEIVMQLMVEFWQLYRLSQVFSKRSWDPAYTAEELVLCRFVKAPKITVVAKGRYHVTWIFREVFE